MMEPKPKPTATDQRIRELLKRQSEQAVIRSEMMRIRRDIITTRRAVIYAAIAAGLSSPIFFYAELDFIGWTTLILMPCFLVLIITLTNQLDK